MGADDEYVGPRYYDRHGQEISLMTWAALFEDKVYQTVKATVINDRWLISTVWLGLDHGLPFLGDPRLIFETMVFDRLSQTPARDIEVRRYSTEAQALQGHAEMVSLVSTLDDIEISKEQGSRRDDTPYT